MEEKNVPESLPLKENHEITVNQHGQNLALTATSNGHPKFKKQQSLMEPVYRLVGINSAPTSKEVGTLVLLGIMVILFIISGTGFIIMWCTQFYDNTLSSNLILAKDSVAANNWINPPVNSHLKVHIFNYTNIDKYLSGEEDKIKVDDLGPYTYEQFGTKRNVIFNDNYTVTFNDHRSFKFRPELSNGRQDDKIVVPNVPFLSASVKVDGMSFFKKMSATYALKMMDLPAFKHLEADSFLWGYNDEIIRTLRTFSSDDIPEKFGILMNRNGTSRDTLQMYTGEDDLRKIGLVSQFNGMPNLDFWSTEECNRIDGSDASQFPPYLMENKQNLDVFTQALCRKLPLEFEKEVDILDGITVWRYRTPMNVFDQPDENPDNACYCENTASCLPSGVFNGTLCYDGAPIYPSFPHFFSGNPLLYKDFEGINPEAEKHQTYADIHPRFAFPMDGSSKIQINILLHKGDLLKDKLRRMENGLILPVVWLEISSGEINDDIRTLLFHSTFSVNAIQYALKYGTLLICVTSFSMIVAGFYYLGKMREEHLKKKDPEADRTQEMEHLNKTKVTNNELDN